jgi:hypothetical protein
MDKRKVYARKKTKSRRDIEKLSSAPSSVDSPKKPRARANKSYQKLSSVDF